MKDQFSDHLLLLSSSNKTFESEKKILSSKAFHKK